MEIVRRSRWTLFAVLLLFLACRDRHPASDAAGPAPRPAVDRKVAEAAVDRARTTLVEVSDILAKQVALQNQIGKNDPAISDAIRQYESQRPEDRARFVVADNGRLREIFAAWGDPTENIPATPELRRSSFPFTRQQPNVPVQFDLAIRKTDVYAQQVRLTNALFRDADPQTMSAVDAWEKMSPAQKQSFSASPQEAALW